jgi:hypothetical protein
MSGPDKGAPPHNPFDEAGEDRLDEDGDLDGGELQPDGFNQGGAEDESGMIFGAP